MRDRVPDPAVILLIEPDQPLQNVIADVLTEEGYRVVTAASGGAGLMLVDTAAPQLVLLNLRLPDISGATILKTIRHNRSRRALPVVVLSTETVIPPQVDELAHAVVRMPFDLWAFVAVVRDVVPFDGVLSPGYSRSVARYH